MSDRIKTDGPSEEEAAAFLRKSGVERGPDEFRTALHIASLLRSTGSPAEPRTEQTDVAESIDEPS
ncbi:MAG TPA: hypothetical protein VLF90_03470 [Patescibacteria group bacterium]|nr:hypothetical protein [Patescibacteria group bacterium]